MNATAKQQLRRNVTNDPYSNPTKTYSVPSTTNEDGTINIPAQPVYGIDPNHEPIDAYMAVRTNPGGTMNIVRDATANTSTRTYTVPANKKWVVKMCAYDLTADATVGNRIMRVDIGNGAANVWVSFQSAAIVAAAAGNGYYEVGPLAFAATVRVGVAGTGTATVNGHLPDMILPAGYTVRIWDANAVSAAGDDMTTVIAYVEYDA